MTYGWSILIIAIVLAALFQLGVFNSTNFAPKAQPGACQVFRPNGPGSTQFINTEGVCNGELPEYVGSFNGQSSGSSYVSIPVLSQLNGASGASFSAWFYLYLNSLNLNERILLSDDCGTPVVIQIYIHTNGQVEADYGNGGGWFSVAYTPTGAITTGKWYDIVTTYLSGGGQAMYINGVLQSISYGAGSSSSTGTLGSSIPLSTGDIADSPSCSWPFAGYISNEQIYNTSLSPPEITALYDEGIGGAPINLQNLVGWWPLNGNANDYSGNGNDGTSTNVIFTSAWTSGYTAP